MSNQAGFVGCVFHFDFVADHQVIKIRSVVFVLHDNFGVGGNAKRDHRREAADSQQPGLKVNGPDHAAVSFHRFSL